MVQKLVTFSKKSEISLEPTDLNAIVIDSVSLMQRTFPKTIDIETRLDKDLRPIDADASQIEQVLMNLCINAREAMQEGGKLKIETRNVTVNEDYCKLHAGCWPGPHVRVTVSDSGKGMDAETLGRIFDPFFTTKGWDFHKGTGLGLSVAKGIVEQHGGWISCESEPDKGTTFRFYFPAIRPAHAKDDDVAPGMLPKNGKILIVDDEEPLRDVGRRILEEGGYEVLTVSKCDEALAIYAREQASISLILLDLVMPQMSGEKCLAKILGINPRAKVLVSSSHSLTLQDLERLLAHAKGLVNKPYETTQLIRTVKSVLQS